MSLERQRGSVASEAALRSIRAHRGWFLGLGVVLVLMGSAAMVVPAPFTLAVEVVLAWVLIISGAAQFVHAFQARRWKGVLWSALCGAIYCSAGAVLLARPAAAALGLTLLLGGALLADGLARGGMALGLRGQKGWWWVLLSAGVSLLLGLLILGEWPSTAAWVLGLMFGVSLMFNGWSMIMLALAAREK